MRISCKSFLHHFLGFRLEVLHNQSVPNSQLPTICVAQHNATGWATCRWRIRVIARSATCAAVDEKFTSSAHFAGFLRFKVEGTGCLVSLLHDVDTIAQFVNRSREGTGIDHTLLGRIIVALSLARISKRINGIFSRSTFEPPRILVVVVGHRPSWGERGTATFGAGVVAQAIAFSEDKVHKGDDFLGEVFGGEGQSQSVNQDAADQQDF